MKKTQVLIIAVWLLFLMAVSCTSNRHSRQITIAVPFRAYSLPLYIAQEKGFFNKNKLNLSIIRTETGHDAYERVTSGISDMALVPEDIACRAGFDENVTVIAVLTVAQNEERIVYRTDRIHDVTKELTGKRVGFIQNSVSGEAFFDLFCEKYGISKMKVTAVRNTFDSIERDLSRGDLDAAVVIEPYGSMLMSKKLVPLEVYTERGLHKKYLCLIVNSKLLIQNRISMNDIFKSLVSAEKVLYEDAKEATRIADVYFGKSVFQTEKMFIDYQYFLHIPPDLETVLQHKASLHFPGKQVRESSYIQKDFFEPDYTHRVQLHKEIVQ